MSFTLFWMALLVALLDWIAVATGFKSLEYIAKPGMMVLLIIWFWLTVDHSLSMMWFFLGAVFSLGGDIFLMLPEERFLPGLISFLLAHISYIIGFNQTFPPINLASLILLVLISLTAISLYRRLDQSLSIAGQRRLKLPILAYTFVIGVMLFSALTTLVRPDDQWMPYSALLVSGGALLFFISDAVLAWNRFIESISHARLNVIISYHLGQIGILLGAALHLMK